MTEYPGGMVSNENKPEAEGMRRGRGASWERRLSDARERRREIIAERDKKSKPRIEPGGAGNSAEAVRELASVLRGDERIDEAGPKEAGFAEHSQPVSGPTGITPNRLAEARRMREQAIAAREGGEPVPDIRAEGLGADGNAQPTAKHPAFVELASERPTLPLPPVRARRGKRKSRLPLTLLFLSMLACGFSFAQARPDIVEAWVSALRGAVAPTPVVSAEPAPAVSDAAPAAPAGDFPPEAAQSPGTKLPNWAPRRTVLPLVPTTVSDTPVVADFAPPASLFDTMGTHEAAVHISEPVFVAAASGANAPSRNAATTAGPDAPVPSVDVMALDLPGSFAFPVTAFDPIFAILSNVPVASEPKVIRVTRPAAMSDVVPMLTALLGGDMAPKTGSETARLPGIADLSSAAME